MVYTQHFLLFRGKVITFRVCGIYISLYDASASDAALIVQLYIERKQKTGVISAVLQTLPPRLSPLHSMSHV